MDTIKVNSYIVEIFGGKATKENADQIRAIQDLVVLVENIGYREGTIDRIQHEVDNAKGLAKRAKEVQRHWDESLDGLYRKLDELYEKT